LHYTERSNSEIMEKGWGNPNSYETKISDKPITELDELGAQNAPQATSEMKDVIGSMGQKVGVSAEGADLTEGAEAVGSGIQETISSGITAGTEGVLGALETADVAMNALDFIPVVGEISAGLSLLGGIGLTVGSAVIGGEKEEEQQSKLDEAYNNQLYQSTNYAGKYASNNFSSQHMF